METSIWYGLIIGNSRLHWSQWSGETLLKVVHTPHWCLDTSLSLDHSFIHSHIRPPSNCLPVPEEDLVNAEIWIASVVPSQTKQWQGYYGHPQMVTLADVPLSNPYPSLGIDRALAVWGAENHWGCPVLVIDGGTALTITGMDAHGQLVGGAILPGLMSQFVTLSQTTAMLPWTEMPTALPKRWALDTTEAITSGIIHTLISGIQQFVHHWWLNFPGSPVVLTGGDGDRLYEYLTQYDAKFAGQLSKDSVLVFKGLSNVRRIHLNLLALTLDPSPKLGEGLQSGSPSSILDEGVGE